MALESKRNIAKYIIAFGGVQGLSIIVGVVRNKVIAVLLGPNGMGILSLYNSAMGMLQNLTNMGIDKTCVPLLGKAFERGDSKEIDESIKQVRSLFAMTAMMSFVVGVLLSWMLSIIAFGDVSRTLHFMFLSMVPPLAIIAMGEVTVLKVMRRLKSVAMQSVWTMLLSLAFTIPMYYEFREHAILPSLLVIGIAQMLTAIIYSYRRYPLRLSINSATFHRSKPLLRMGILFVIAGSMTSASEFLVRAYLNNAAGDKVVGLYNTACIMALTYGGMLFASIDSEYYPRLSQIPGSDITMLKATIRRQIVMSLAFIIPMIVVMEVLLPWIVPLLFNSNFVDAVPATQIMLLALLFRAIYLPIGYIPLVRSDSRTFVKTESLSAINMFFGVTLGYHYGGLTGSAMGMVLSHALDVVSYVLIIGRKYLK